MINQLQLIRNLGQFELVACAGSIPLKRLTLVYSENGRGKTTLAAVLRSLATGDPVPIAERRRLSAQQTPHVVLGCSGGPPPAVFQDNCWNRTIPNLVVFDDVFVDENVHSGLAVHANHRQNLHELILGTHAIELSTRVQQLVARIEEHNRELRIREAAITAAARGPFSVEAFCALPERADIDSAIAEAERSLASARDQAAVQRMPAFDALQLPELAIASIQEILQRDLPAIDAATLVHLQAHFTALGEGGEAWVSEGMGRIQAGGDDGRACCPFCAQSLGASPLLQSYRNYFGEAYSKLKGEVADALASTERAHGGEEPAVLERAVRVLIERRQFWARFCDVPEFTIDTAAVVRDWGAARVALVAQLAAKQAAPLERLDVPDETLSLIAEYETHRRSIASISEQLQVANQAIQLAKTSAATADVSALAQGLARLRAIKDRHDPTVAVACDLYAAERAAKQATERERDQAKAELERHRTEVFPRYQAAINAYLECFFAGFRLDSVTPANTRGGPTCTYSVLINNTPVPIGGVDPPPGSPSFRTALSAGDRNTLALAFFFASLDQDPNLANKVVVIDDPISSLDEHRTLATVQQIRRLAERAGQVIVLSHNKPFLCRLWERADPSGRSAIEVVREGASSTLRLWDVSHDSITEHDRRDAELRAFLDTGAGEMRDVARSLRPHLEAFLRVVCPSGFPPGTQLGNFRRICQQRLGTPNQLLDQNSLRELEEIVEYANRFHHDPNAAWATETVNDQELRGFVERALRFAGP